MISPGTRYERRDDPKEVVQVLSQENTLNGKVWYHMVEPRLAETERCLTGDRFDALYIRRRPSFHPPQRPDAEATKEEWRQWALHLERIYQVNV
jgi:hypothetical protein